LPSFPYSIFPSDKPAGSGRVLIAGKVISYFNKLSADPLAQAALDRFAVTGVLTGVIAVEAIEIKADEAA
jgi:hypothetical protein